MKKIIPAVMLIGLIASLSATRLLASYETGTKQCYTQLPNGQWMSWNCPVNQNCVPVELKDRNGNPTGSYTGTCVTPS